MITRFLSRLTLCVVLLSSFCSYAQPISITTWNIEWLTLNPDAPDDKGKRSEADFQALSRHFQRFRPDVLAFQEVDSIAAIQKVVGNEYRIVLSERAMPQHQQHQFSKLNQYTGFAIKSTIPFDTPADIDLYGRANHKLRFATYVILYPDNPNEIHLLSVHLKAGCAGAFHPNTDSCQILKTQGKALNRWLQERERHQHAFMILGDFNHNLAYQGDWLWKIINQELNKPVQLATQETPARCQVRSRRQPDKLHRFRSLIDHIIVSSQVSYQQVQQMIFPNDEVLRYRLSDHCPIHGQFHW